MTETTPPSLPSGGHPDEPAQSVEVITTAAAPADVTVTSQAEKPASHQLSNWAAILIALGGAIAPAMPAVGPALAAAGVSPLVVNLVTGIGAVLLAAYQEKRKTPHA